MRELTTETYQVPSSGGRSGVIVERDAEPGSLTDESQVPDVQRQPLGANDTIRPQVMPPPVREASDAEEQWAIREARTPVTSRLPVAWLVGLLVPIAAAVVAIALALPRRRSDQR